jgi:hypothetical protein
VSPTPPKEVAPMTFIYVLFVEALEILTGSEADGRNGW